MAIIAENEYGWIICPRTYFNQIYELCMDDNNVLQKIKLKDAFFDIRTPFFTSAKSKKCGLVRCLKEIPKVKKKKKNENIPKNQIEDLGIIVFISRHISNLITIAKNLNHLEDSEITSEEWFENNSKAREAASKALKPNYIYTDKNLDFVYKSSSLHPVIKKFGGNEYVLPPQATFHLCDISSFFETVDEKYDLIIIDPPWVNRCVKREKRYRSLKYDFLRSIPFEKLKANPGCLIVVWITNSSSAASFVTDHLFPKCNVAFSSMWHWCKITRKGDFVYPIDSHHKKPYENLLLGRVQYDSDLSIRPAKEINTKKVLVSVPSSIHSCKPPLVEILKPYIKPNANCLELFARYLLPGWKSVGNEVLKLQDIKLFDVLQSNN